MAIYMKADNVQGNVQANGYQGWIKINHFNFAGISNVLDNLVGKTGDRITRRPDFGEIFINKPADASSIYLFERSYTGEVINDVQFHFVSTNSPIQTYEIWELKNVLISQVCVEHSYDATCPTEDYSLNYTSFQRTYQQRFSNGSLGNPVITGYDLSKATKL